jgi:large-conductance mechanosensitive channel
MKTELITFLYVCAGVVSTTGYFPTIKDLLQKKKTANIKSYLIWTICTAITLAYATFVVSDIFFIIMAAAAFTLCATILVISLKLNKFP